MLRQFTVLFGSLLVTAVVCPAASAGPMSWSYVSRVLAGDGSFEPPAGAVLNLGRVPAGTGGRPDDYAWSALPTGSAGRYDGGGQVVLAELGLGSYQSGEALPDAAVDRFRTVLEITDTASGVRGFTYMQGRGSMSGNYLDLSGSGRVQMLLGNNRYDITWRPDGTESVSRIVADVSVTSLTTVTTPEPATLALAGLGLGVVGVRRLRRRG